jgi:two-component system, OmpR family, phosphate regulon response regulator PhoB
MASRILVVEDEPDILEVVLYNLKQAGFEVEAAEDGESALSRARERQPDLVLLDLMLPGIDGLEVCKLLKQDDATRGIPIIMLTARAEEVDRIVGFELGADDYVVKPFSPRELILRIRAILRRVKEEAAPGTVDEGRIQAGPMLIDIDAHTVTVNGHELTLTATEFKLLVTLAERRGRVQSRDHLLASVWGYEYGGYGRTVDTHVRRLREKLGEAAGLVETVRGVGYRFRVEG